MPLYDTISVFILVKLMPFPHTYKAHRIDLLINNHAGVRQEHYEADIVGQDPNQPESQHRRARNLLRFLIQGTEVERGQNYQEGLDLIEKALVEQRDPDTLDALRKELQNVFKNAYHNVRYAIDNRLLNKEDEQLFIILLSNLISLYSFFDPVRCDRQGNPVSLERVKIPQKINKEWILVTYKVKRLDISPQTGILSEHKTEDKIYAYGFQPLNSRTALALLSFRGTPPPTLPGAQFATLYNFKPNTSIGEGHNMEAVNSFIRHSFSKIVVVGHSQGGTMALITGMRFPEIIDSVHALNPAALSSKTLERFGAHWESHLSRGTAASLNVYAQEGDPVPYLGNGFPQGTHFYNLTPRDKLCSNYKPLMPKCIHRHIEAHIRFFSGQEEVLVEEQDLKEINNSSTRALMGDVKEAINLIKFPINYVSLVKTTLLQKQVPIDWLSPEQAQSLLESFELISSIVLSTTEITLLIFCIPIVASVSGLKIATLKCLSNSDESVSPRSQAGFFEEKMEKPICPLLESNKNELKRH